MLSRARSAEAAAGDGDGDGMRSDLDRLARGPGADPERSDRVQQYPGAEHCGMQDVGFLAVRGDGDDPRATAGFDRPAGGVAGRADRGERPVEDVDHVGGLAVRGDGDAERYLADSDRRARGVRGGPDRGDGALSGAY